MPSTIRAGTFRAGKTAVTGVGFRPTAIWFYTSNLVANGYGASYGGDAWEVANGFAARPGGDQCVSTYAWDGGQNGETKNLTDRALEFPRRNVTNGRGTMTVASFDPDGFSLSYPVAPTDQYLIGYIAFDCAEAKTFNQMWGLANSNVFAGFGFQPDILSHWLNGAHVNTNRTTSGSPSESALGTSIAGRNTAQTTSPGSTVTRSNGIAVSTLLKARSWARSPGPYGYWGAAIYFAQWEFGIASWDADGFTLSEGVDQTQMALLGMALAGDDMYVETGKVILAANMDDVIITPTDVTVPRAFIFHTHSSTADSVIADEFDTVAVSTGCFDGESQFHCGTAFNSVGQFDDRYCVKFDLAGTGAPIGLEGVSIVGNTLTLSKSALPAGGETFVWTAIGLGDPRAVSMYTVFPHGLAPPDPPVQENAEFVQLLGTKQQKSAGATSLAMTFTGVAIDAGESIFVAYAQSTASLSGVTCTDNLGNTYTIQKSASQGANSVDSFLFGCLSSVAGTINAITITLTTPVGNEGACGMVAGRFRNVGAAYTAPAETATGDSVQDSGILKSVGPTEGIAIGARGQRTTSGVTYNYGTLVGVAFTSGDSNLSNCMVALGYAKPCTVNGLQATKQDGSGNRPYAHVGKAYQGAIS